MKSLTAALGAVVVLALTSGATPAAPIDAHLSWNARAGGPQPRDAGLITFTNPLRRSRGVGAGAGQL
jgi:hypothetical protein